MAISTKASGVMTRKMAEEFTLTTQLVRNMKVSGKQVSVMAEVSIISHSETLTMDSKNKNKKELSHKQANNSFLILIFIFS